jgi:S-methylmethionine-dependent homocysteine/selenocysteine methylase/SAM-dependent methyltransferase
MDDRYARIMRLIATDRCVTLDGAIGTELVDVAGVRPEVEEHLWGLSAVLDTPDDVRTVHRRYVDIGVDVLTTDTWGLATALRDGAGQGFTWSRPVHWMDVARDGVRLARAAAADGGRADEVAVAFSINDDIDTPSGQETIRLLGRALEDEPPDLILAETLSLVRSTTYATVETLLEIGLPVWLSFRRCRQGVCGVYGEHWGGPEGDAFGRAARRFEEMGVGALLINCVPPDHAAGMVSWLRDFTDLPLGVYPNRGYLSNAGWESDVGEDDYAQLALQWRAEGAQIIGGCCGVGVGHVAAAAAALAETKPGTRRPEARTDSDANGGEIAASATRWHDARERPLFPVGFPDLTIEDGVAAPNQASLLIWKYLYREGAGAHQRCLDVGSGCGLLATQLALNGARHVHAIDIQPAASRNTLANAFRNGATDRVTAATVDLYPWVPEERYDLIVSSLPQLPVDPFEQTSTHRPLDYWGRNLLDHLIALLPAALADDGVAYVMQLSIAGEQRTLVELERAGLRSRVVDYGFVEFEPKWTQRAEQIARVEERSDGYHLSLGDQQVMVAYLLEVTRT